MKNPIQIYEIRDNESYTFFRYSFPAQLERILCPLFNYGFIVGYDDVVEIYVGWHGPEFEPNRVLKRNVELISNVECFEVFGVSKNFVVSLKILKLGQKILKFQNPKFWNLNMEPINVPEVAKKFLIIWVKISKTPTITSFLKCFSLNFKHLKLQAHTYHIFISFSSCHPSFTLHLKNVAPNDR